MTLTASIGHAQALNGREAGLQATHQALNKLGSGAPAFGFVIASHQYQAREVVSGVSSLLGDTPVIGFSSPVCLTGDGLHPNSVVVGTAGGDMQAETHWMPGYAQSGRETGAQLSKQLADQADTRAALFLCRWFQRRCGSIVQRSVHRIRSAGRRSFLRRFAYRSFLPDRGSAERNRRACLLRFCAATVRVGIGAAHGWNPVGSQFRVTRSRGFWLRTLDGRPASETYAQLFGYPAREWAFPPLSHLARLYPLGVEQGDQLIIRSPIRVEADGSFRMNAPVRDGVDAYLLVGSRSLL